MPTYFTAKQERQYEHIKKSCVTRRCRRKSKRCVSTCKRIAAATVNKFRGRKNHRLGNIQVTKRRDGNYEVSREWAPGRIKSVVFTKKKTARKYAKKEARRIGVRVGPGLGAVRRGRCCVVKNKRKIACFTDKQQAIDFKAAIRRTRGTRVFCFRKQS